MEFECLLSIGLFNVRVCSGGGDAEDLIWVLERHTILACEHFCVKILDVLFCLSRVFNPRIESGIVSCAKVLG